MITVETVGQRLRAARAQRKLSLEDASRATKIRARQLADLERDQYSNFPNLTYAKGFLVSYGKYLDVDVRPSLGAFEDANTFGLDNYQYLSDTPLGVYRATRRPTRRRKAGRQRYFVLGSLLGVFVLTFLCWQLYVSYRRLGDLDKLADHQEALARGVDRTALAKASSGNGPLSSDAAAIEHAAAPRIAGRGEALPPLSWSSSAEARDSLTQRGGLAALPLPGDGGAVRQMMMLPSSEQTPDRFLVSSEAPLPSPAAQRGTDARGEWTPENPAGYRFYVRSLDRNSVEIFRTGIPRPETALNNPL